MAIYKRKAARKVSKKPRVRRAPKKTFAKKVLAVIHKQTENKTAYESNGDILSKFSGSLAVSLLTASFPLLPTIARGTNEAERIGNQVRALRLRCQGAILYAPSAFSLPQSRICVRQMVIQPKIFNSTTNVDVTTWFTQLLQKGNTTVSFLGKLSDLWAPINRDAITVYHDKLYYMDTTYAAVGTSVTVPLDMQRTTKLFDFTVKCKNKLLRYEDNVGSGLYPTNFAPFMVYGWAYMDGSAIGTLTDVGVTYNTTLTYEDS